MAPLAFAAERRLLLLVDISCSRGAQQQTRRTPLSIDGTDTQTDARPFHRPRCAYYAGSVNNLWYTKFRRILRKRSFCFHYSSELISKNEGHFWDSVFSDECNGCWHFLGRRRFVQDNNREWQSALAAAWPTDNTSLDVGLEIRLCRKLLTVRGLYTTRTNT